MSALQPWVGDQLHLKTAWDVVCGSAPGEIDAEIQALLATLGG